MEINVPAPLWLLRWIVRRNPWLLADNGMVSQTHRLDLGIFGVGMASSVSIRPDQRERLIAEQRKAPAR